MHGQREGAGGGPWLGGRDLKNWFLDVLVSGLGIVLYRIVLL